jgi:hypothetical protein
MLDDLDEVLRKLLIRELPVKNGEIDITFDQPRRDWSARLSRPTLNVFLYDVRENQKLRQTQPLWDIQRQPDGTTIQRRKPVRVDAHYMVTAWASTPEDEHRLLSRALLAFFRYPDVPEDLLPESLQSQTKPMPITAAQYEELHNVTDVWQTLDNDMRPAIGCIITLALDPYAPLTVPLVRARELRIGPSLEPVEQLLQEPEAADRFWTIGGMLRSAGPLDLSKIHIRLLEQEQEIALRPDGRFAVGHLRAGEYTLEISVDNRPPRRYPFKAPAADYDFVV